MHNKILLTKSYQPLNFLTVLYMHSRPTVLVYINVLLGCYFCHFYLYKYYIEDINVLKSLIGEKNKSFMAQSVTVCALTTRIQFK